MGFDRLFSPLTIRSVTFRNRVLSTGHQTFLARDGRITDDLIAYHRARAVGGAGAIIVESARFHETAFSDLREIHATTDACVDGYRRLAQAVQGEGTRLIGQLSHLGRCSSRRHDGMRGVVYLRHAVTGDPILCEGVETVVLAHGATPHTELEHALSGRGVRTILAGDCLSPRSAEEAVYEGFLAGLQA